MSFRECASGVPAKARVTTTAAAASSSGAMRLMLSVPTPRCTSCFVMDLVWI